MRPIAVTHWVSDSGSIFIRQDLAEIDSYQWHLKDTFSADEIRKIRQNKELILKTIKAVNPDLITETAKG